MYSAQRALRPVTAWAWFSRLFSVVLCTPLNGEVDSNLNPTPTPPAGSQAPAVCTIDCHLPETNWAISVASG